MATYSNSPRLRAVDPVTPIHSPHHSVHSSASSRLSVRNLTLHEYRKQQSSSASHATPPGKTLRRKPAAFGLKKNDRVPSPSPNLLSTARAPPRQLHISQSAQSIYTYQQLPPSPPHQQHEPSGYDFFRSQSADPSIGHSQIGRTREFKPIKRLPKPLLSSGHSPSPIVQSPLSFETLSHPPLSPQRTAPGASFEHPTSIESQTTSWPFSFSRFPRPPDSTGPLPSLVTHENERPQINTVSFASTAPATPPTTPAVIHYRGASFDLVNPHTSLVLDNIVTPSHELDSSDCLPLLSSRNLGSPEMVPKRPLYGDLSSAYASIIRRGDEYLPQSHTDMPLPPTPVAQSPGSSAFDSQAQSPEWHQIDRKPSNDSRFSLKQVARSLAHRFSKGPEKPFEQELRDFSGSHVSLASASFEGEFPRSLERSYRVASPKASIFSDEPITPVSPLDQSMHLMPELSSPPSAEQPCCSTQRPATAPLSSMFPDIPSTQFDRAQEERPIVSESNFANQSYYDDIASVYPSSSIYTDGSRRQSTYLQNRIDSRKSNPYYWRMSENADAIANLYNSDALSQYASGECTSRHVSRSFDQAIHHPEQQEGEKADTISKFIDQYKSTDDPGHFPSRLDKEVVGVFGAPHPISNNLAVRRLVEHAGSTTIMPAFGKFQHNPEQPATYANKSTLAHSIGPPPSILAPLAPAFAYNESLGSPERSDQLSKTSSYGDTQDLLQFPSPSTVDKYTPTQPVLQSSSSYSQPSISLNQRVPCQALQQAEEIFATDACQQKPGSIPTIWSKRVSSHNLSRNAVDNCSDRQSRDQKQKESLQPPLDEDDLDRAEWETVGNGSPHRDVRASLGESLADCSISEGSHTSRDSMGFSSSFSVYGDLPLQPGAPEYRHTNPLRDHSNPFVSDPPALPMDTSMPQIAITIAEHPLQSISPASSSSSVHVNCERKAGMRSMPCSPQQEYFPSTPWANAYAFSDKETQELLASGPNDEIMYECAKNACENDSFNIQGESSPVQPSSICVTTGAFRRSHESEDGRARENSFEKFTVIDSKGNLTGTPHGTGMYDTGSSVADNSSPGGVLDSSPSISPVQYRHGHNVFEPTGTCNATTKLVDPHQFSKKAITVANQGRYRHYASSERMSSIIHIAARFSTSPEARESIIPRATFHDQDSPFPDPDRRAQRLSLRSPKMTRDPRRGGSRAAVPGQTKLRQMVLAPIAQTLSSSDRSLNDSGLFGNEHSARPSTSNTDTPLRTAASLPTLPKVFANQHSPHLLCPERALDVEEEAKRRKLSWVIFAVFCVLPPMLILYRWMGDMVIVNVTNGRFAYVDPKPKNIALGAGIAVNASIIAIILLPILIAHFAGSP